MCYLSGEPGRTPSAQIKQYEKPTIPYCKFIENVQIDGSDENKNKMQYKHDENFLSTHIHEQ